MAEFICRLGTPAGEVVTRTIEAPGIQEARTRLEREGFRVFNVTPPRTSGVSALTRFGRPGGGECNRGGDEADRKAYAHADRRRTSRMSQTLSPSFGGVAHSPIPQGAIVTEP